MKYKRSSIILIVVLIAETLLAAEKFPAKDYLKIVTIFTNDMHGGIDRSEASFINPDFPPMLGGGAVAGRYILQKRQEAAQNGWGLLLIDAGDFYQGTPLGTVSEG
ncbi:MAG TPA: multifunctional 2',3'-cyclic-nucleotide 2'-phosphodiesterase/5'-nucleotidase/3'-nucleotidase, partial [Candidatus Marinimicrobia bacterium]|nr:multifunctional 2',3'-cyclic-nucleotide 2'-phosphodiesterase/5'-nucleotidase/3'-nucleotidase [Candidatus Neomarinimicrobiota bacterium]